MRTTRLIQTCTVVLTLFISGLAWGGSPLLPDALVLLPESEHAIIVEKKTQTLYVYESGREGVRLVSQYPCSTGEVGGPKTRAGDKKTPEGVYFLKDEYEDRYLAPVYGKKAFPSDYPNFLDLRQGKQGSAIWIHGTDKALKPMDSNGCVAMENDSIMAIADLIRLDGTPLIIVEQMATATEADLKGQRARIQDMIQQWAQAMVSGSYHEYLAFYAADYLPDMSWWEAWQKVRGAAMDKSSPLSIGVEKTGLYAQGGVVVALMDMSVSSGNEKIFLGKRQLFVRTSGSRPLIIGDFFQKKAEAYVAEEAPLLAASMKLSRDESADKVVVETVEQWLAAWSAKDMSEYAAFYASDFFSEGMGKAAWVKRKKKLAKQYDYIQVTGSEYKITRKKDGYKVSFLQTYESSGFSTRGIKQLKLVKQGGLWKIYRENWKGK